jgi:hypothetical protein
MSRPRNPRVVAVERLRNIKRIAEGLVLSARNHSGSLVYDFSIDHTPTRDRLPHEYAENMPEYWHRLRRDLRVISEELVALDALAIEQIGRLLAQAAREMDGG